MFRYQLNKINVKSIQRCFSTSNRSSSTAKKSLFSDNDDFIGDSGHGHHGHSNRNQFDRKKRNNKFNNNNNNDNDDFMMDGYKRNSNSNSKHNNSSGSRYKNNNEAKFIQEAMKKKYTLVGEGLYGIHPTSIAINSENRSFNALYIQNSLLSKLENISDVNTSSIVRDEDYFKTEDSLNDLDKSFDRYNDKKNIEKIESVLKKAIEFNIPIYSVKKTVLDQFSKDRVHQGIVLDVSPYTLLTIDSLPSQSNKQSPPLWIFLDELWDPKNIGAIVRSCHFFKVDGIVVTNTKSCPITPESSKNSAGAVEEYPIHRAESVIGFIRASKQNGWRIIGTSPDDHENIKSHNLNQFKLDQPTLLLIGNEGFGLKTKMIQECDSLVKIVGGTENVDSLNASASTAVMIYQFINTRPKGK
ncbi:hypothetical protein CYY_001910 [Polysphondylium violaceum]|uniref:rRNA methyltransferase 1, mitochondrial n=1 Tax=Polysphondylium violaceum TaxID=133409 RepID=A0A8J4V3G0_9MYCE|nr:hypothetical protein CYY_001910 [Polysphondylium violaceum]